MKSSYHPSSLICLAIVFIFYYSAGASAATTDDCVNNARIVVTTCQKTLDDRLALNQQMKEKFLTASPDATTCCYVAEFNDCVTSGTKDDCGSAINQLTKNDLGPLYKKLLSNCSGYDYPSARCYFYVWFWYIIGGLAIVLFISAIACFVGCCCR